MELKEAMSKFQKIRRGKWGAMAFMQVPRDDGMFRDEGGEEEYIVMKEDILATDWEEYREKKWVTKQAEEIPFSNAGSFGATFYRYLCFKFPPGARNIKCTYEIQE